MTQIPKVTAKTITDAQIRALMHLSIGLGAKSVVRICRIALDDGVTHRTKAQLTEARERCAAIINDATDRAIGKEPK